MSSITLGVAALVAINSFRSNAQESVKNESRALLGADLRVTSNRPWPEPMKLVLDSAKKQYEIANVVQLVSMGVNAYTGDARLVQLRAIERGFPFYGDIETAPANQWGSIQQRGRVVVEESVLSDLGMSVGDTLLLGEAPFVIAASLKKAPSDFSFRSIMGPRVYMAFADLEKTGLMRFGSLAQHQAYYKVTNAKELQRYVDRRHDFFRRNLIGFDTAEEQSQRVAKALEALSRFLGLVGLAALLLGGIGVATAVHVFVKSKRSTIAVLRCLGARERTVFAAYLLQAVALSFVGALAGVVLGLGVQALLPRVMSAVVPFKVSFAIDWISVGAGLGVGLLVALLFAVIPLLSIRGISPLHALRIEYETARRRVDPYRILAAVALIVGLTGLSIWQAGHFQPGLAFAGALAGTLIILSFVAWLLTWLTRRLTPKRASFPVRQGIANLYRPHNQTVSVTLSLGFGVFVIATMLSVQTNLLGWLNIENRKAAPNILAFDIQSDQVESVRGAFAANKATNVNFTPIVPAKIKALNGKTVDYLVSHSEARKVEPWALRREYRNTYRDTTVESETVVAGKFGGAHKPGEAIPISMERELAGDLNLKLGDRVTWDFQGVEIESKITSLRKVDWAEFNTNFFVVFPNGVIENAPHNYVALGRVPDAAQRRALQRDIVVENSNVSIIDLAGVREALENMISKVTMAVRFMALFSIIAGIIVLIGAVATSRFQRLRESALLKTLGATRSQITRVLVTEYAALGLLAGATGVGLALGASWGLMKFFFKLQYKAPLVSMLVVWVGVTLLAVVIGLANSRDVFRRAPLAVLREISE
ncbi:MAG TPA: FtsX-like permease family protein [Longimicrobiales bacterium]|nr:FtsX-like permease family protein [Longimicrobiales bacterium]